MSGANFNITTQPAAPSNLSVIDIYNAAQMPLELAPDGVMRWKATLTTKYIFHPGVVLPRVWIPEFVSASDPETIEFTSSVQSQALLVNGSTIPHIWGRDVNVVIFRDITIRDTAPLTTKLFDLVGGTVLSSLFLDSTVFLDVKEIGNIVDVGVDFPQVIFVDFERGLVSRNNTGTNLLNSFSGERLSNTSGVTMQSPMLCFLGAQSTVGISSSAINLTASDSAICIDSAATGTYDILGNTYNGIGDFFALPISNTITAFANADIAITSFSASPVVGRTSCNFATPTDLVIGQTILIADEPAYDGVRVITRVAPDQLSVDINVLFSTAGPGTLKKTRVTSVSHGLVRDQTTTIAGTTSYNQTSQILQIVDNDNFDISVAFVADDATGTASATSQDEKTPGVVAVLNGKAKNSRTIGVGEMNGNATVTTIALADTYQAIDLSTVVENAISERFTLTDATAGIFTYNGEQTFIGTLTAVPTAIKSGTTEIYRHTVSINGAIPVFASEPYAPMEIANIGASATVIKPVSLEPGDTVQVMAAGDGTSDNLTYTDITIRISL